jgi:uroporphyrinogen decarboxylase
MTRKQAFMAVLRGEEPDRVPVSPLIHHRFANVVYGRTDWRACFEVHQALGSTHYRGPIGLGAGGSAPDGYEYREEVVSRDGPHLVTRASYYTPLGDLRQTHASGMIPHDPLVGKTTEYFVKQPRDWEIIMRLWHEQADTARPAPSPEVADAVALMGEDGVPSVGVNSAYAMMGAMRGMAELLFDLIDDPGLMREVAKAAWRVEERVLESFTLSASEVCFYDICWATGSHMGPALFEKWVGDEIRQACERVRAAGKYITFYTLGRVRKLMDCMVDAGPHLIATFEPNEGDITLAEAKRLYGKRIALMGNFDCVVLARGSLEEARREAKRCLDEGMAGGGYILGTADEVPADAKWDNLRAMVEAAEEYGRY